jgi:hypothetical protein
MIYSTVLEAPFSVQQILTIQHVELGRQAKALVQMHGLPIQLRNLISDDN